MRTNSQACLEAEGEGTGVSDEADLVRRCRLGDRDSFEGLVKMHSSRTYNVALGILGHADDAEDAAQEAFVRLYEAVVSSRFRGDASISTWLYRVVTNLCLDEIRRRKVRPLPLGPAEPASSSADIADVAGAVEASHDRQVVRAALERLPAEFRAAVVLRDMVGLSYEEVARITRCPVGTVRSRLSRGRGLLRRTLGGAEL